MCNANCFDWAKRNLFDGEIIEKRILEVGSYDVNGSLRSIIEDEASEYIGVDIQEGPGVNIVCPADRLEDRFGEESFDVVISTCALEHIDDWKSAVDNIKAVCKRGGLIVLIVPSKWGYHAYPHDYWRYGPNDIERIFSDCVITRLDEDPAGSNQLVYAKIRKPNVFVMNDLSNITVPMAPKKNNKRR